MKINILKIYAFVLVVLSLAVVVNVFSMPVLAGDQAVAGLETAAGTGFGGTPQITSVPEAIGRIIGVALAFVGLAFFILMLYGGFTWMFARGNDQQVEKAKGIIQTAVIGLIIVLMAYAITAFVGNVLISDASGGTPR
jgi:hypothetical protein